ncbi:putative nucleic acid-binding, replication factor A [Arabidopsis thaliana]
MYTLGKYAEIVDQACQESTDNIVVCLIRFAKINLYNGNYIVMCYYISILFLKTCPFIYKTDSRSVSNCFDVSQVFVDPTLPELGLFNQSIPTDGLTLGSSGSFHKRFYAPKTGDDDGDYPRQTIKEVLTASDVLFINLFYLLTFLLHFSYFKLSLLIPLYIHLKVGKCKTVCTVSAIDTDWSWYYFCCRAHNEKVVKEEVIKLEDVKLPQKPRFWCEICNGFAKYVVAKFWLHLHIMDQTGEARCMLFDSHAKEILGTTAPELLDGSFDEIEDPTVLPDVINGLKWKTFQFLLCIQRENIFSGYDSFTVAQVYTGNIADEIVQEDSDAYVDPSSLISIEQGSLILTNGVDLSDVNLSSTSTPSSKRKDSDDVDENDQASTSRNKCSKMTMSEEGSVD